MNMIGCLDTPSSGTYLLEGLPVGEMGDDELADIRNRKIGFVFQTFNLLPRADVFHNVELPLVYAGVPGRAAAPGRGGDARWGSAIAPTTSRTSCPAPAPARGHRRALVGSPSIILADEPTGNLDSRTGAEIMRMFDELHAAGQTIILVTHEDDIAAHARRTVRLRDGLIESDVTNGARRHAAARRQAEARAVTGGWRS